MRTLGALGLALLGCQGEIGIHPTGDGDRSGGDVEDVGGADPGGPDAVSDPLFETTRVHEVRIELGAEAWNALATTPTEYALATVQLDGARIEGVGVRLKGNNSFRPITQKPSFKIKLDEFDDRSYGRLESVTLNNMIEDASLAREALTYWLWNDAGQIAPRAAYTRVYVDDEYFGLYLLLESIDRAFVTRRFEEPDGDLWEGEDDADFTTAGLSFFDHKCGEDEPGRLAAVATALNTPTDDFYTSADRFLQMDQVIDYWAWTMATANLDGYPYTLNDFVVYADPGADGRLTMSPWGMDESWNSGFRFQWGRGVALFNCAADNACLERVLAHTEAALEHYEAADVPGQLRAFYTLTETAITTDTRMGRSQVEIQAERDALLGFVESWPATLRAQMYE